MPTPFSQICLCLGVFCFVSFCFQTLISFSFYVELFTFQVTFLSKQTSALLAWSCPNREREKEKEGERKTEREREWVSVCVSECVCMCVCVTVCVYVYSGWLMLTLTIILPMIKNFLVLQGDFPQGAVKGRKNLPEVLDSSTSTATSWLCDLGQVSSPLCVWVLIGKMKTQD